MRARRIERPRADVLCPYNPGTAPGKSPSARRKAGDMIERQFLGRAKEHGARAAELITLAVTRTARGDHGRALGALSAARGHIAMGSMSARSAIPEWRTRREANGMRAARAVGTFIRRAAETDALARLAPFGLSVIRERATSEDGPLYAVTLAGNPIADARGYIDRGSAIAHALSFVDVGGPLADAIEARADRERTAPLVIPREHETAVLAALALAALTYAIPDGPRGPLAALDALAPGAADSLRESIAKRNADADAERREGWR